jgi:Dolichyl-phosphate-mannose-protein mannosyltransferase
LEGRLTVPIRWIAAHRIGLIVLGLVLLGLGLRAFHYLRQPPIWHDEATVVVNVLDKDYSQLLGPLQFDATGPPLFLWLERTAYLMLGESPLALRLLPFLASCAALLLIVYLARSTLQPAAVPWAVFLFAVSEQLLWHTCEAKPYATDVFMAALLATVYCALRERPIALRLLALMGLAPIAILLSYPAALVYGGLLLTLGIEVWKQRLASSVVWLLLLLATVVACFGWVAFGPARAQETPALVSTWTSCFPDWQRPWAVPGWAFVSFLEVCRYCAKPLGQPLAIFLVIGLITLWRSGRRDAVLVFGVPVFLALAAALAHRYPFGGVRVMAYAAPAILLFIAAGIPPAIAWLRKRFAPAVAVPLLLLSLPLVVAAQDVIFPWDVADPASAAAYIQARRLPSDRVIGNDWTHSYYFHELGADFVQAGANAAIPPKGRVWVVITSGKEMTATDRLQLAASLVPPGWSSQPAAEFSYTTVVLACKPPL